MTKANVLKIAANLLFLVLFGLLFSRYASWQTLVESASALPPVYAIGGFIALSLTYVLRTHRFYGLLKAHQLPWLAVFKVMLRHNAINNLLPFRLGEFSFPILLKRQSGVSYTQSGQVLITARLFDLLFMAAIGGVITVLAIHSINTTWAWIAVLVGITAIVIGSLTLYLLSRRGHRLIQSYLGYVAEHASTASYLTIAIWLFKILGLALLLAPMLQTQLIYALLAVMTVEATAILPVNGPANFGSLEGAVVAVLLPFGLTADAVFSAVLNLHIAVIMLAALGYVLSLFIPAQPSHKAVNVGK